MYSNITGIAGVVSDGNLSSDVGASLIFAGMNEFTMRVQPTGSTINNVQGHWTADARL
jgi:hypothetical protein